MTTPTVAAFGTKSVYHIQSEAYDPSLGADSEHWETHEHPLRCREGEVITRWLTKGFWAVMDQGLFATSNFVLNVLLARWLTPHEYGAFGVAFAVFLFILGLHQAMFQEPMLVFGPGKYKDRLPRYLGALLYGNLAFAALCSLVLLLLSSGFALWGSRALSEVMLALALAGPLSLILWVVRRACYTRFEPHVAALSGAWYMVLMLAGAYVLYRYEWLSAASALVVMGISSLAVSLWLIIRLGIEYPPLRGDGLVRDAFKNHWDYGRWSVANQSLNWIPLNLPYLILPIWSGLAAGAVFKALINLIMPIQQGVWALSTLLLPFLVQARAKGHAEFRSRVRYALIPVVLGPVLYWVCLGVLHYPLTSWLYGGRYTEQSGLLWLFGFIPVFIAVKLIIGNSLRALERPDWLFFAYALSAAFALTLGIGLMYFWGVAGAGAMLLFCQAITAALAVIFYRRRLRLASRMPEFFIDASSENKAK